MKPDLTHFVSTGFFSHFFHPNHFSEHTFVSISRRLRKDKCTQFLDLRRFLAEKRHFKSNSEFGIRKFPNSEWALQTPFFGQKSTQIQKLSALLYLFPVDFGKISALRKMIWLEKMREKANLKNGSSVPQQPCYIG